ncbi:MAG TPA: hypothetical protein VFI00_03850 [Kribbella sp.]|nr:hypothetical protein [Kribbella sp.]
MLGSIRKVLAVLAAGVLALAGLGPILWLAKAAISPTRDIASNPLGLWSGQPQWHNIETAWSQLPVGPALINTVWLPSATGPYRCWWQRLAGGIKG